MSILPIVIAPDERLIKRASKVIDINNKIKELVNDMFETLYDAEGLGLAAVQVGVLMRVFVIDIQISRSEYELVGYKSTGRFYMINPEITELSDEQIIVKEGCLSIPEQSYEIKRPKYLTVKYKDLNNDEQTLKACCWLARCIQHELDHLDGILYIKYLSKLKYDIAAKKAEKVKKHYEQ